MKSLDSFMAHSSEHFTWYQNEPGIKHQWRTLVFSCYRGWLEEVALDAMLTGVSQCKISNQSYKLSKIYNLTIFHETIAQALAFRHKWYDHLHLAIAGPLPLKIIESQFLKEESREQAVSEMMEVFDGIRLSVDIPGNRVTLKPSKSD